MHKNLLASLILTLLITMITTSCTTPQTNQDFKATFYVSPDGNDQWNGTAPEHRGEKDGPFKTLAQAQQAVRSYPWRRQQTIVIALRKGTYTLTEPWTFTPEDSGAEHAKVIWTAFADEQPVISGGQAITGWTVHKNGAWTVTIPQAINAHRRQDGWDINQLFVNGTRRHRARFPKPPHVFRMTGRPEPWTTREEAQQLQHSFDQLPVRPEDLNQCFAAPDGTFDEADARNAVAVIYNSWTASRHHVSALDAQTNRITLAAGTHPWPVGYWEPKGRYHLENLRNALTEPGEWHLDYQTGTLTYLPLPGETPDNSTVVAPVIPVLLQLGGDAEVGLFTSHLTFKDLTFLYASHAFPFDRAEDGQAAASQRGAIRTRSTRDCTFQNIRLAHVGGYGFDLGQGSRHNVIRHCEITDMGAGGVRIGEPNLEPDQAISCAYNTLENSFIHDGGHLAPAGVGAIIFKSSYNTIRHNDICDLTYSAVSVGWSWGYDDSTAHHNLIEYNHLHHLGYGVLSDMGAVYTLGLSPGTVVRGNTVHDVYAYSYGGWGLYADEGSTGIVWEDNLVYNTKSGAFFQHYGRENTVRHNLMAFAPEGMVGVGRCEEHLSLTLEDNLIIMDNGRPYCNAMADANTISRNNIYWDLTGQPFGFNATILSEWQEDGHELGSIIADPLCRNPRKGDFTLNPDSPALAAATPALEAAKVAGLFGSPQWTRRPYDKIYKTISPHALPVDLPRPRIMPSRELRIDFKHCRPGDLAPLSITYGENEALKTSIRVTDEMDGPASKNALKFVDAPNQPHPWQPHLVFPVSWMTGTVTGDFDVYLNSPQAILWHEWRDDANPFRVGPSLRLKGNGDLLWNQRKIGTVPLKTWIHVSLRTNLGTDDVTLTVTPQGQQPMTFKQTRIHQDWNCLKAILFVSEATQRSDFYIANIDFRRTK